MNKPDDKAPDDKAPDDKMASDKKASDKKPDDKMASDKGIDEKKGDNKKASDKKPDDKRPEPGAAKKSDTGLPTKSLFVDATLHAIDTLDAETVAIGLCADVRPLGGAAGYLDWRMCGRLSSYVRSGTITGAAGEKVLLPCGIGAARRVLVFGWGPKASLLDNATARFSWMVDVLNRAGTQRVAVALPEPAGILVGLVDAHLKKPLGDRLVMVFVPDPLMADAKDTRPIPAAPRAGATPAAS